MNQHEIEWAASRHHDCPNVRTGLRLLSRLVEAVNRQSDGWAYWPAPSRACEKLIALLQDAGNLDHGTRGRITDAELKYAIAPIRKMAKEQQKKQAEYGNTFEFDVDAAMLEEPPVVELPMDERITQAVDAATKRLQDFAKTEVMPHMVKLATQVQKRLHRHKISFCNGMYSVRLHVNGEYLCDCHDILWASLAKRIPEMEEIHQVCTRCEDDLKYIPVDIEPQR